MFLRADLVLGGLETADRACETARAYSADNAAFLERPSNGATDVIAHQIAAVSAGHARRVI
ncbi:MAG: hypothetical protein R3D80_03225 [Paracoccaceae bacterium]